MQRLIRIGQIPYLNFLPFYYHLAAELSGEWEFVPGNPASLSRAFARGELDCAPVSSVAVPALPNARLLLEIGLASKGSVESVLLVTRRVGLEAVTRVAVSAESLTSVALLSALLARRGLSVECFEATDPLCRLDRDADGALLIGDAALILAVAPPPRLTLFDLGRAWEEATGLPMVWACWAARADLPEGWAPRLDAALTAGADRPLPAHLAEVVGPLHNIPPARLVAYWRRFRYRLDPEARRGLETFRAWLERPVAGGSRP